MLSCEQNVLATENKQSGGVNQENLLHLIVLALQRMGDIDGNCLKRRVCCISLFH